MSIRKDNINGDVQIICYRVMKLYYLIHDLERLRAVVNRVMNFQVP